MTQVCKICSSPKRLSIDREIVRGGNLAKIARDYDVSSNSLYLHAKVHVSRQLARAADTRLFIEGNELLDVIQKIIQRAENIFRRNYNKGADVTALRALDSQRNTIQLLNNISAQVLAAKKLEHDMAKERSGENKEQLQAEYSRKLRSLTYEEMLVYQRLADKLMEQTDDIIIRGGRVLKRNGTVRD
jgi:transposase-like protein